MCANEEGPLPPTFNLNNRKMVIVMRTFWPWAEKIRCNTATARELRPLLAGFLTRPRKRLQYSEHLARKTQLGQSALPCEVGATQGEESSYATREARHWWRGAAVLSGKSDSELCSCEVSPAGKGLPAMPPAQPE